MSTPFTMKKAFKKAVKVFNEYSKSDRHAILLISALIFVVFLARIIIGFIPQRTENSFENFNKFLKTIDKPKNPITKKYLFQFDPNTIEVKQLDSLDFPEFIKRNMINYRKAGGIFKDESDIRKIYGMTDSLYSVIEPYILLNKTSEKLAVQLDNDKNVSPFIFDPNTAGYDELTRCGFNRFQANNLLEYRRRGGNLKAPADLLKIYGIDSMFFKGIEPFVQIKLKDNERIAEFKNEYVVVELNSADSTDLFNLNGIGPVYARRIIKYRSLLGGFYAKNQLLEVYGITEEILNSIEPEIQIDTLKIQKIRVNFAEYRDFLKHPYLNKKQIEAILKYREKNGAFQNTEQLKTAGIFDDKTFYRVLPYFSCR